MQTRRRLLTHLLAAAGAASLGGGAVRAQDAKRMIRIVVGFPAGGGTDVIARLVAERVKVPFASSVIVENRPGAAARASVDYVKAAEPDGSTLLFTPDFPITLYPHSFRSLSYDPMRDLVPVAAGAKSMLSYAVGPAVPDSVTTLASFVKWCRDNPKGAQYATTAAGGTPHFVGVMFANAAGLAMTPVHYRGGAPALQDLIGGHVPASINPIGETMAQAQSGGIRILAVTGAERSRFLPNVPTMREQGFDVVVEPWLGFFAPARTPPQTVRMLAAAINDVAKSKEFAESLAKFGNDPALETGEAFTKTVRTDLERWAGIVKASGFVAVD